MRNTLAAAALAATDLDQSREMYMNFSANTTMAPKARRIALVATTALALAFGAATGFAQPAGGMMHGGPGMHGEGAFEMMMPKMLEQTKASLNLNTSQQPTWDNVVAQGKAAREAGRTNHQQVKAALQAELAKPAPDLVAVAAVADGVEQQNRALRKQVRDQWLALYATFSPEQKGVVRDLLQKKMARAEGFRAKMRERIQQHLGPAGG
jgi:Spy/CpxP family protein refolding chaperone